MQERESVHPGMESFEHALDQTFVETLICSLILKRLDRCYLDFTTSWMIAAVDTVLRFNGFLTDVTHCGWIFFRRDEMHSLEGRAPAVDEFCQ